MNNEDIPPFDILLVKALTKAAIPHELASIYVIALFVSKVESFGKQLAKTRDLFVVLIRRLRVYGIEGG